MQSIEKRAQNNGGQDNGRLRRLRGSTTVELPNGSIHINTGSKVGQVLLENILSLPADLKIRGEENLTTLRTVLDCNKRQPDQAVGVWGTLIHTGHLDFPKVVEAIVKAGGEDFRERIFLDMGNRVDGTLGVGFASRFYPFTRTPQPYDAEADGNLSAEELAVRMAEDQALLRESRRAMDYFFKQGRVGLIAPTGSRKKTEVIPQVVGYFKGKLIMPIHIDGSAQILAPGRFLPSRRGTLTISFGEIYPFSDIEGATRGISSREEQRRAQASMVMDRINALAPQRKL